MTKSENDDRAVIDQIKAGMPIVDFLEKRGHRLIRSGPNRWKMLCPFHDEKTPSCMVSEAYNTYHCFGCGASGDIFNYLEAKEGLPFPDALEMLADELHIDYHRHRDEDGEHTDRRTLRTIVSMVYQALHNQFEALADDHPAKRNIAARHIEPDNAHNHDLFGWAGPDDTLIVRALNRRGFKDEQIVEAGVARMERGQCRLLWRDRLTFVIRDLAGNPVGFTGRIVYKNGTDLRKYVNSAESPLFHKSNVLFCEDIARRQANEDGEVYVVEGQFDVIAMQHIGKLNTVASSGTAFTESHAGLLKRMVGGDGRIVFAFDADNAGQKAAVRTFGAAPAIQPMAYAAITGDKDASDMYRDAPDSLRRQMASAHPLYQHIIDWMASNSDMSTERGRAAFVGSCMESYATITDPILMDNFITYMALKSGIDVTTLRAKSADAEKMRPRRRDGDDAPAAHDDGNGSPIILDQTADLTPEDYMLALCYEQPNLAARLDEVRMQGPYERLRIMIRDHAAIPGPIVARLSRANEGMRQFELYSPLTDIDELFDAQKRVIETKARRDAVMDYHRRNISAIDGSTSPDNVRAYSRGLAHRLDIR